MLNETRIDSSKFLQNRKVITSTKQTNIVSSTQANRVSRSLITFVNANGNTLLDVLVSPTKGKIGNEKLQSIPIKQKPSKRGDVLYHSYVWNKTGWLSKYIWEQSIKKFIMIMKLHFSGRKVILVMDRLAAHLDPKLVTLLLKNNIHCLFIPTKSSHLLQPLDQYLFSNFKKVFRKKISQHMTSELALQKPPIDHFIMEAEHEAFKSSVIKKSFEVVGLVP